MKKNLKRQIDELRKVRDIAVAPGNFDSNEYMLGMANGLILAMAIMEDKEPEYLRTKPKNKEPLEAVL